MTVLANVTEGVTLLTGTLIPGTIATFSEPPLVYFVAAGAVMIAWRMIRKSVMPRKGA